MLMRVDVRCAHHLRPPADRLCRIEALPVGTQDIVRITPSVGSSPSGTVELILTGFGNLAQRPKTEIG
jgi:hypothetical protein